MQGFIRTHTVQRTAESHLPIYYIVNTAANGATIPNVASQRFIPKIFSTIKMHSSQQFVQRISQQFILVCHSKNTLVIHHPNNSSRYFIPIIRPNTSSQSFIPTHLPIFHSIPIFHSTPKLHNTRAERHTPSDATVRDYAQPPCFKAHCRKRC